MSFITQGKTNLQYVLIIVVLAVIVGGGISWLATSLGIKPSEVKPPEEVKAYKIAKDFVLNEVSEGWVLLENASEIPYQEGDKKNPKNYESIVQPNINEINTDTFLVTLYTWTTVEGGLAEWEITTKNNKVTHEYAKMIDLGVGHYTISSPEETYSPEPGKILVDRDIVPLTCPELPSCPTPLIYGDPDPDDPNQCPRYVCPTVTKECEMGVCPDGSTYEKYTLTDGECIELYYLRDPCATYINKNSCNTKQDCVLWQCAGCFNKDYAQKLVDQGIVDQPCWNYDPEEYLCGCVNNRCIEIKK